MVPMDTRDPERLAEFLYGTFRNRVYGFCYDLCGHAADAEDLTQDVLLMACRDFYQFQGRSSLITWLCGIALHRWKNLKRRRRLETVALDDDLRHTAADPFVGEIDRMSLERALAMLPDGQREAFLLVKEEGLKYREAARILGVPQGTVQRWVHEASLRLRAALADELQEAPAAAPRTAPAREPLLEPA